MNPEERAIHYSRPDLQDLLSSGAVSLTSFTTELVSNDFIDGLETNTLGVPDAEKVRKLLDAVQVQVRLSPRKFEAFIRILSKTPALQPLVERLTALRASADGPQQVPANGTPNLTNKDPLNDAPTYAQLGGLNKPGGKGQLKIMDALIPHWSRFACALNFDDRGETIGVIEANNRNASGCCADMLKRWLAGESRSVPITWRGLSDCLESIGLRALARDVREAVSLRPSSNQ